MIDTFIKYIRFYAIKKATTKAILNKLIKNYLPNEGKSKKPKSILTNNVTKFRSKNELRE